MKKLKFLILLSIMTFTVSCGQQKRYVQYKVKDGETMRSIAKRYNIKTKDLLRLNPDVGRRPDANTVIVIPNKKSQNTKIAENTKVEDLNTQEINRPVEVIKEEENSISTIDKETEALKKDFVIHKVKPKETIYGLTRFYNITKEELFNLNPLTKTEGLKIGQILKIKPILTKEDSNANNLFEDAIKHDSSINLVMLLPFRSSKYDSVSSNDIFKKNNNLANIVTDFYLGSKIAIDSIKNQGVQVNLQVFDTEKKNSKINSLASSDAIKNADAVIGPFYYEEAKLLSSLVKTSIVFPMYSKNQTNLSSSKISKIAPSKEIHLSTLTSYLSDNYTNENIIVVGDGKASSNIKVSKIVSNLKKNDSITNVTVLKPIKNYIKKERFLTVMKPKTHTWVIIASSDNVAVADALNSMISLPEDVTVQVFTTEKTKAFNNIDNHKLAKVNFSYVTNEYIDEKSEAVKMFNKKYKALNYTLPSNYATKGFDITYDVLARLASSGNNLKETYNKGASLRLESKFDYDKNLFGSTTNKGLFIVKYNEDLSLTRLR